jgi:acetyl esterase/lipase
MRTGFAILLVLLAFLPRPGHAAGKTSAPPSPPNLNQAITFPNGVMVSPGLTYAQIDGFRALALDVYQVPSKPKETPRPAILFVHDGLWIKGDRSHAAGFDDFPGFLASLAAKGYVVASVDYRLSGEAHFPAAVQDVKSAIRWFRNHATDYNIDTTRVMIWGTEAGGQIAAMVGASCGVNVLEPTADAQSKAPMSSDCVQGVIDWAGPTDLTAWDTDNAAAPMGAYLGCEPADCAPGVVKAASPTSYLDNMTPPFLIQQGVTDTLVPLSQSRKLYEALQALHVPSTLVAYPDVGENFTRNGAEDSATHDKAIADAEDFITKTFPPAPAAKTDKPEPSAHTKKKHK